MTLEIGQQAPDFELRDQHGQTVTLSGLRGRAVILVFYPFAFSGVCTGELCEFRDNLSTFESDSAQLLGISCDPMYSLRAFADRDALTFPLLSDFWPHGEVSRAYDVFDDQRGCSRRSSFLLDEQGVLRWSVHNALPASRNLEEHARALSSLGQK